MDDLTGTAGDSPHIAISQAVGTTVDQDEESVFETCSWSSRAQVEQMVWIWIRLSRDIAGE